MWVDALRVCREYLPNRLPALQAEYDRQVGAKGSRDVDSLLAQAREWEQNGEYKAAVDCLLKVCCDSQYLPTCLTDCPTYSGKQTSVLVHEAYLPITMCLVCEQVIVDDSTARLQLWSAGEVERYLCFD